MLHSSRTKIFRCNKRIKLESEMYCFCQFNGCKTVSNDMPTCNIYQTMHMNSCQDSVNSICSNYHKCIKDQFVANSFQKEQKGQHNQNEIGNFKFNHWIRFSIYSNRPVFAFYDSFYDSFKFLAVRFKNV